MKRYLLIGLLLGQGIAYADYPSFHTLGKGIIYSGPITTFNAGSVKAANGDILVQFNSGSDQWPGSTGYLIRSKDEGLTWEPPYKVVESTLTYAEGAGVHTNIGLTKLSNGDLVLPFTEGMLNPGWSESPVNFTAQKWVHAYVIISHDNGYSWGPWIPCGGFTNASAFGQIVERTNGDLLLPIWTRDSWGRSSTDPAFHDGYVISHDHGLSWGELTDFDSQSGELSLLQLSDNSILGLGKLGTFKRNGTHIESGPFRAGKSASLYLSPHGFPILSYTNVVSHIAFSNDNGARWWGGFDFDAYIPNSTNHTYALSVVNLDSHRLMVIYFAQDPGRSAGNGFLVQNTYLAYEILDETVNFGNPTGLALTDPLPLPPVTQPTATTPDKPYAFPCPWRSNRDMGRPVTFANVPTGASIRIFNIAAELVKTLAGNETWDLTNTSGERVASGIYIYLIQGQGFNTTGKLAVIR